MSRMSPEEYKRRLRQASREFLDALAGVPEDLCLGGPATPEYGAALLIRDSKQAKDMVAILKKLADAP